MCLKPTRKINIMSNRFIVMVITSKKSASNFITDVVSWLHYLQNMPVKEYAIILGQKWFRAEWNPSKQLVWDKGDACLIPLTRLLLVSTEQTFSYIGESVGEIKCTIQNWWNLTCSAEHLICFKILISNKVGCLERKNIHLRGKSCAIATWSLVYNKKIIIYSTDVIMDVYLLTISPWAHLSNNGSSRPVCLLMMWLINDLNLAQIILPVPHAVVVALQCRWLTQGRIHSESTSPPRSFAIADSTFCTFRK